MITYAIDPGACTGWAVFDGATLVLCGVCDPAELSFRGGEKAVIERPDAHRGREQKAKPESIATLLMLVGQYTERARVAGVSVQLVKPSAWKGAVPKDVHQVRVLNELTSAERIALADLSKTKRHNMIDAIGLGLWSVGRLPR